MSIDHDVEEDCARIVCDMGLQRGCREIDGKLKIHYKKISTKMFINFFDTFQSVFGRKVVYCSAL